MRVCLAIAVMLTAGELHHQTWILVYRINGPSNIPVLTYILKYSGTYLGYLNIFIE